MKIGAFCRMFGIQPETVRFYINKGLLVPAARNGRYIFSDQDGADMEYLLKLKEMNFSLAEIHKIMSLKRLSNFDSTEELSDYVNILKRQKNVLLQEKSRLKNIIAKLEHEIKNAAGKHTAQQKRTSGVPLTFLPYLACPHCQRNLSLSNCNIEGGQILSGVFLCPCGYKAAIQNGIIIGEQGAVSIYDGPDLERSCYRNMSPDLITLMSKNYQWMQERIDLCCDDGMLVLEDFINDYCYCHANFEAMNKNALYVLTDKFPEIVAMYKNLIDRMNLEHQVLYIAAAGHLLPLREGCVDLYIDLSTNEYAMFHQGCAFDALARYFHKKTAAVGSFWHLDGKGDSIKELFQQYPDAWNKNFDVANFANYLPERWHSVIELCKLGSVLGSGDGQSFSYHAEGEELSLTSYYVKGFRTSSSKKESLEIVS